MLCADISGSDRGLDLLPTVNAYVDAAAASSSEAVAIKHYGPTGDLLATLTFQELRDATCHVAARLRMSFAKGDAIGLWGNNGIGWVVFQLAILRIGGIVVTLDPALRAHDLRQMLKSSGARGVIMDREYRGHILQETLDSVRNELPELEHQLRIEDWRELAAGPSRYDEDECTADDPALIVFTSGTTGAPKGVVLHHGGVVGNACQAIQRSGLSERSALLNPLPAYSVGGAVCITLGALTTQRPQIIINHFDAGVVIDLTVKERFGWMPLVPAMLLPLVAHPRFAEADFSCLESVWMGGTVITPDNVATAKRELGCTVVTIYGQTESSGVHSMNMPDASPAAISATVGIPLSGGRIRIADLNTGKTLDRGEVGEIRTKSPFMARSYFRNPEATRNMLDEDGWLRTGDLGLIDSDGLLRITGRLKEMIIRGGRNIYPREIEDVLSGFPGVIEVAVLGVPHPRWGEEVAAAVRMSGDADPDFAAMERFLEERIAAYKVPKLWRRVDDFPRGSQAKIRKVDLAPIFAQ